MSNQNLYKSIFKAYEKYFENEKIEELQYVLESNLSALEGLEHAKISQIKKIINTIEYARFLCPKNERPQKVKESLIKLKQILEIEK